MLRIICIFLYSSLLSATALHRAISEEDFEDAKILIETNAVDIDEQNANHNTALHIAIKKHHLNFAQYLLEKGANPNIKDDDGFNALQLAIRKNLDPNLFSLTSLQNSDLLKATNKNGETALMYVAQKGNATWVKKLLDAGSEINAIDNDRNTALNHAAKMGKLQVVKLLVERGASIKAPLNGESPLQLAKEGKWDPCIFYLENCERLEAEKEQGTYIDREQSKDINSEELSPNDPKENSEKNRKKCIIS